MNEYPMTLNGKKLLEKELEYLIKVEREKVKQEIAEARALGDLRENAEYAAAKEKQSLLEGRIMELQAKLAKARVVDTANLNSGKIVFGATVELYDVYKQVTLKVQIVGEDEAMLDKSKISYCCPLGKALIGKEVGDEVLVQAPKGEIIYEILNIEFK